MFTNSVLAVSGALLSVVAAVPMAGEHRHGHQHQHQHHAREYVWETKTDEVIVTVPVTKTVWIEPGETPPTYPHPYGQSSSTTAPAAPEYTPKPSSSAPVAPAYTPKSSSSSSTTPVAPAYTSPSSTSVYVAPTPSSTSVYVAPTPSTTAPAAPAYTAPSSSAPAAPAYTSASASSGSDSGSSGSSGLSGIAAPGTSYTGDLTWYDVGLGACGLTNVASDHIVAISEKIFDTYDNGNPNNNPLCGKYVTISGKDGSTYKAKIVDRCTGCAEADLDLSQDFFNTCTSNGDGRVSGMKWTFD